MCNIHISSCSSTPLYHSCIETKICTHQQHQEIDQISDQISTLTLSSGQQIDVMSQEIFKKNIRETTESVLNNVYAWIAHELEKIQSYEKDIDISDFAFMTTGSDGRYEKGNESSQTEIVIITNGSTENARKIQSLFQKTINENKDTQSIIYPIIEIKDISTHHHKELLSIYYYDTIKRVIPTRPLDALFIIGNNQLFSSYKKAFIHELIFKKIKLKKFTNDFVTYSIKTLTKDLDGEPHGTYKNTFIDIQRGIVFYNGIDIKGVKYGAIRSIQYSLALFIITYIQKLSEQEADHFLQKLPRCIDERIQFLSDQNLFLLTHNEVETLKQTYLELLSIYIECQKKHQLDKTAGKIELRVEKELLKSLLETALHASKKIISSLTSQPNM